MAPVPKKKIPKSAQGKRRSHLGIRRVSLTECPHCHSARPSHQVCPTCGYYKGREAVEIARPELPE
jgi:large subunit ribosomal protein L32